MILPKFIKVAIVEDHYIISDVLNYFLMSQEHIEVVLLASNGLDFLNNFEQSKPDVVILDLNMPIMDGFETLIALRKIVDKSQLKIIIHSSDSEATIQNYCIQNGANDFVVKGVPLSHLYKLILNQFQDKFNS